MIRYFKNPGPAIYYKYVTYDTETKKIATVMLDGTIDICSWSRADIVEWLENKTIVEVDINGKNVPKNKFEVNAKIHWRDDGWFFIIIHNGEKLVESVKLYSSRYNAKRAGENFLKKMKKCLSLVDI